MEQHYPEDSKDSTVHQLNALFLTSSTIIKPYLSVAKVEAVAPIKVPADWVVFNY